MLLKRENGRIFISDEKQERAFFEMAVGQNGKKYCVSSSVSSDYFHVITEGNSKTGPAVNVNFPIEYTCNHTCECYREGLCYASGGCYQYASNQAGYTENFNFYRASSFAEMLYAFQLVINNTEVKLWRYFTCGDIPDGRFFDIMCSLARMNPTVKFWAYTKKYHIVNAWIQANGAIPSNLKIIFSHWMNKDGSFFPMNNPYALPTSEFIPFGREELIATVTHVCPCSDPTVNATCATCDHPCYTLEHGQSMALLEHSTAETRKRDKEIKTAKKALAVA